MVIGLSLAAGLLLMAWTLDNPEWTDRRGPDGLDERARLETDVARSDLIFDSMAEGLLIADEGGRVVVMNRTAERLLGSGARTLPLDEWTTQLDVRLHDGETRCPNGDFPLAQAVRGEPAAEMELLVRGGPGPDNTWITGGAQPIRDQERLRGAVMVFRNVSTRKRAELALDEERTRQRQLHSRQASIGEIDMSIHEADRLPPLLDRVADLAQQLLASHGAHVTVCDDEIRSLLNAAGDSATSILPTSSFEPPAAAVAWIVENAQPLSVADVSDDPFQPEPRGPVGAQAYAGVPLTEGDTVVGILFVHDASARHFAQAELDVMAALAERTAVCLTKVRLYERLRGLNLELARHREQLESLVNERTEALEESHRQLRQSDRLASIGTLTAGLGHDMNNVLFPVRCRLDALNWKSVPRELQDVLQSVAHAVAYLQQLTDGLRLFALDPEDAEASASLTSMHEWWNQVSPLLTKALPKDVKLVCTIDEDLPLVRVAPHRLTQALLNLVVNAGEAMPAGGLVRIRADATVDRQIVRIAVSDEGQGMTAQIRSQAFDPFFTTKTRGLSTGLGLSLVHGVVASSRGTIDVETAEGEGTTMTLSFPAAVRADGAAARGTAGGNGQAEVHLADGRLAAWIGNLLRAAGYDVCPGTNGEPVIDATACTLWVTDAVPERVEAARRFLTLEGRRMMVLGPRSPDWEHPNVTVVEDCQELNALRAAIDALSSSAPEPQP